MFDAGCDRSGLIRWRVAAHPFSIFKNGQHEHERRKRDLDGSTSSVAATTNDRVIAASAASRAVLAADNGGPYQNLPLTADLALEIDVRPTWN